jgi:hypothetical protein
LKKFIYEVKIRKSKSSKGKIRSHSKSHSKSSKRKIRSHSSSYGKSCQDKEGVIKNHQKIKIKTD